MAKSKKLDMGTLGAAAGARVGTDPLQRLAWVQDFAAQEIGPDADFAALSAEIFMFTWSSPLHFARPSAASLFSDAFAEVRTSEQQVRDAHADARAMLEGLRQGERAFKTYFPISEVVWLPDGHLEPRTGGTALERFRAAFFAMLAQVCTVAKVCVNDDCRRLFVRHGRSLYCSERCSQRIRTKRFIEANPKKAREARHERHKAKQQAKLGGRVKVKRLERQPAPRGGK